MVLPAAPVAAAVTAIVYAALLATTRIPCGADGTFCREGACELLVARPPLADALIFASSLNARVLPLFAGSSSLCEGRIMGTVAQEGCRGRWRPWPAARRGRGR